MANRQPPNEGTDTPSFQHRDVGCFTFKCVGKLHYALLVVQARNDDDDDVSSVQKAACGWSNLSPWTGPFMIVLVASLVCYNSSLVD